MQKTVFSEGNIIIRQGELGHSFFRIEKGSVDVFLNYQTDQEKRLTTLRSGQFFGEMGVVDIYPRSATVVAAEDGTEISEIGENDLNAYFTQEPDKILELFRHISGRVRSLTEDYNEAVETLKKLEDTQGEKSEGLIGRIGKAFFGLFGQKNQGFSAETERFLKSADFTEGYSGETINYKPGTVIFREGEPGRCMYAVHMGKVGIYSGYDTPAQKLLTELLPNSFFGEMGMIENEARSATAVALENTTVEVITQENLQELFQKNPPKVDMILRGLSGRLRTLTKDYDKVCEKIREHENA
jgi:cAMP-binding proteins - catabolite gene activator and regulatory subunit of cAMP-dependent protein kinases